MKSNIIKYKKLLIIINLFKYTFKTPTKIKIKILTKKKQTFSSKIKNDKQFCRF